jgi:hypothetical protein
MLKSVREYENPFQHNYVFSKKDITRKKIVSAWSYVELWFRPKYVQINDGYEFVYKTTADGRYFLLDVKKITYSEKPNN